MVSAPLLTVGVPIDLPQSQAKSLDQDKEPLTVSVNDKGQIFLQNSEIAADDLIPKMLAVADARGGVETRVYVRGDKKVDYGTMAYGYVLHKDYSLAEQSFRDYLKKYPNERLVPEAQYWLGESLFQQQRYRDAAESFLGVSTKFERSAKAPDALLRLGQSLAAMSQKEAACATLAEVGRKYPRASANVKRGVEQEQKRAHC